MLNQNYEERNAFYMERIPYWDVKPTNSSYKHFVYQDLLLNSAEAFEDPILSLSNAGISDSELALHKAVFSVAEYLNCSPLWVLHTGENNNEFIIGLVYLDNGIVFNEKKSSVDLELDLSEYGYTLIFIYHTVSSSAPRAALIPTDWTNSYDYNEQA